jgi:hypothetical protein
VLPTAASTTGLLEVRLTFAGTDGGLANSSPLKDTLAVAACWAIKSSMIWVT